jgi:hypothetical protein
VVEEELLFVEHLQEQLVYQADLVGVEVELTVELQVEVQVLQDKVIQEEQDFQIQQVEQVGEVELLLQEQMEVLQVEDQVEQDNYILLQEHIIQVEVEQEVIITSDQIQQEQVE